MGRPCVSVTQATSPEQMGAVAWRNCICDTNGRLPGSVFITRRLPPAPEVESAPAPMLAYSRGVQGRVHVTRCVRPKTGMGPTKSSEPPPESRGSLSENMGSAMAGLASLNVSLFIWTVDFGAQGPEIPCCLASQWLYSSAGLPNTHQAAKDTQCGQAEVWLQEGSLGPFPHLSFLKFHVELGAGWHPVVSKGGPLSSC